MFTRTCQRKLHSTRYFYVDKQTDTTVKDNGKQERRKHVKGKDKRNKENKRKTIKHKR